MSTEDNHFTWPETPAITPRRDKFGALVNVPRHIRDVLRELNTVSWTVGRNAEGAFINVSVYDVGWDQTRLPGMVAPLPCALVQIRYYIPPVDDQPESYSTLRKNYALVGRNEDGSAYSHTVPYVALWPILPEGKHSPFPAIAAGSYQPFEGPVQVMDTHWLEAATRVAFEEGSPVAVENPRLVHRKGEHAPLVLEGQYRILCGRRLSGHQHSEPTPD